MRQRCGFICGKEHDLGCQPQEGAGSKMPVASVFRGLWRSKFKIITKRILFSKGNCNSQTPARRCCWAHWISPQTFVALSDKTGTQSQSCKEKRFVYRNWVALVHGGQTQCDSSQLGSTYSRALSRWRTNWWKDQLLIKNLQWENRNLYNLPISHPGFHGLEWLEGAIQLRPSLPGTLPFISFSFEKSLSKFSRSLSLVVRLANSWMSISNTGSEINAYRLV